MERQQFSHGETNSKLLKEHKQNNLSVSCLVASVDTTSRGQKWMNDIRTLSHTRMPRMFSLSEAATEIDTQTSHL